jgi:hypothetical protein
MGNACASENSGEEAPALIYLAESEGASGAAFGEEAPALAQLVARLETAHANAKANATQSAKLRRRICALGVAAAATLGLSSTPPGGTDAAGSALSAGAEPEPEVRGAEAVVDLDSESWSSSSSWSGTGLCRHKGSTGALAPLAAWHGPIPGPIRARYGPDTGRYPEGNCYTVHSVWTPVTLGPGGPQVHGLLMDQRRNRRDARERHR